MLLNLYVHNFTVDVLFGDLALAAQLEAEKKQSEEEVSPSPSVLHAGSL